jgi:hypothetical protein
MHGSSRSDRERSRRFQPICLCAKRTWPRSPKLGEPKTLRTRNEARPKIGEPGMERSRNEASPVKHRAQALARTTPLGLEPRIKEPKSLVLPITPRGKTY